MGIQAIETRYAGCHFRSRLEARWAVFLDELNIKWEYEPQGLMVSHRMTGDEGKFSYLPDFWLPKQDLILEVKGSLTGLQAVQILDTAAFVSSPRGGCGGGSDFVLLGPIPRVQYSSLFETGGHLPWLLHMHKGDLLASTWPTGTDPCGGHLIGNDCNGREQFAGREDRLAEILLDGSPVNRMPPRLSDALTAARSARFEHGQNGARYGLSRSGF